MRKETRTLIKSGMAMALSALIIRTISVYFQAYLSRTIGAEGMGLVGLVGTVYGFATTLAISGIPFAITRLVAEALGRGVVGEAKGAIKSGVKYALIFSTLSTLLLLLGAGAIGRYALKDARTILPLLILSLSLIPLSLSSVISGYFTAVGRVYGASLSQVGEMGVRIISTLLILPYFLKSGKDGVVAVVIGIMLSQLFSCFVLSIAFYKDTRKYLPPIPKAITSTTDMKATLAIALPLAFSTYVRSGLLTLEHILIPLSLGKSGASHGEALSAYGTLQGMALPVVLYPMAILSSFSPLLVPLFASHRARGERGHIQHLAERSLHLTSLLSIGCFYLIHHFSDELSFLLFGSVEAGAYIRPLSWVIPLMFLDHVTDGILKGLGEEVYTMWVNILDAILSCLLVVLLLPHFGAIGYVYVILLAEIFNFLFSIWRLYRVSALRFRILPSLVVPALSGWCAVRVVSLFFPTVASTSASLLPLLLRLIFTASFYILLLSLASHIHFWHGKRRRALDTDRHIMYTI